MLGTFARVSLTRLKDQPDKNKVYALKVLRKADGEYGPYRNSTCGHFQASTDRETVIKLKQVEHVRNERKTLAAVVGHPFITTLVASFSDEQCLYMLVRWVSLIYSYYQSSGLSRVLAAFSSLAVGFLPRRRDI